MRIGEVARSAGVTPRAVRYYEEQGLISPERDHNGHRIYSGDAVLLVRNIARLLHAGLSSEDVLRFRDCLVQESPVTPAFCSAEAIDVYSERLDVLDRRIAVLTELRQRLAAEIDRFRDHRQRHAADRDPGHSSRSGITDAARVVNAQNDQWEIRDIARRSP